MSDIQNLSDAVAAEGAAETSTLADLAAEVAALQAAVAAAPATDAAIVAATANIATQTELYGGRPWPQPGASCCASVM